MRWIGVWCAYLLVMLLPLVANGQSNEDNTEVTVNYVYAAQLGIGGYDVGGLDVQVFTLPLSKTFELDQRTEVRGGERAWMLKVSAPVNLGLYEFSGVDSDGTQISADQQTLAIIPGVELQVPVTRTWTLKPFVNAGLGHGLTSGSQAAYIYSVGGRSLVEWPAGDYTLMLGNGLIYAGNAVFGDSVEDYVAVETGLGVRRATGFEMWGVEPEVGVYGIHYYYPKALVFQRFRQSPLTVENQFEFAMTVGSATPFEIGPISDPRIGVGYIFGDGLEVLRISFGFPF